MDREPALPHQARYSHCIHICWNNHDAKWWGVGDKAEALIIIVCKGKVTTTGSSGFYKNVWVLVVGGKVLRPGGLSRGGDMKWKGCCVGKLGQHREVMRM